jgi:hypothetical protein
MAKGNPVLVRPAAGADRDGVHRHSIHSCRNKNQTDFQWNGFILIDDLHNIGPARAGGRLERLLVLLNLNLLRIIDHDFGPALVSFTSPVTGTRHNGRFVGNEPDPVDPFAVCRTNWPCSSSWTGRITPSTNKRSPMKACINGT